MVGEQQPIEKMEVKHKCKIEVTLEGMPARCEGIRHEELQGLMICEYAEAEQKAFYAYTDPRKK